MKTNSPFNPLLTGISLLIYASATNLNAQPAFNSNPVRADVQDSHKRHTVSTIQLVELVNPPLFPRNQQTEWKQIAADGNTRERAVSRPHETDQTHTMEKMAQPSSTSVSRSTERLLLDREKALMEREKALLKKEKILLEKEKRISVMERDLLREQIRQDGSDAEQKVSRKTQRIKQIISDYFSSDAFLAESVDREDLKYAAAVNQQFTERSDNKQYTDEDIEEANRALASGVVAKKKVKEMNVTNKVVVVSASAKDPVSRAGRIRQLTEKLVSESTTGSGGASSEVEDERQDKYISQLGQEALVREKESRTVEVKRGDSLWLIAVRMYGNGWDYTKIYRANPALIKNPDLIYPGQLLRVPL